MKFRTDSSNAKPFYLRNRIRQDLIPVLTTFNPNVVKVLSRQSKILREETIYLDHVAEVALEAVRVKEIREGVVINRTEFLKFPRPIGRRMILKIFRILMSGVQNPPFEVVESLLQLIQQKISGSLVRYKSLEAIRDYNFIRFTVYPGNFPRELAPKEIPFPVPGSVNWPRTRQRLVGSLKLPGIDSREFSPTVAHFDADQFSHLLVVRIWQSGDEFYPFGLGEKRKTVKKFFSDIKLSRSKRYLVPLIVAPEGIVWIGGYRTDHRFRVTDLTTKVLRIEITGG